MSKKGQDGLNPQKGGILQQKPEFQVEMEFMCPDQNFEPKRDYANLMENYFINIVVTAFTKLATMCSDENVKAKSQ